MTESVREISKMYSHVPKIETIAIEEADFTLEQVQLQFDLANKLRRLLVENNKMYILTSTHVIRIDLENPSEVLSVQFPSHSDLNKLSNAWLHPSGDFLIIQMNSIIYYHLHLSYKRFKSLHRFKGIKVNHVAFHRLGKQQFTGDFLMTTEDGHVLAANIKCHDPETEPSKRDDKYVKQIFSTREKIQGLAFSNNGTRVVVALDNELLLWDCFEPSLNELLRSLHHPPISKKLAGPGSFFATCNNYYYFVNSTSGLIVSNDPEIKPTANHLSCFANSGVAPGDQSFMTSKYHIFYSGRSSERLHILNKLSPNNLRSIGLPSSTGNEKILGIVSDNLAHTHWVFTRNKIYELIITNEDAAAWVSYYELGEYDHALQLIEATKDSELKVLRRNVILVRQGYDLLQRGGFGVPGVLDDLGEDLKRFQLQEEGVKKLALLNEPFEKICLMLVSVDELENSMGFSHELMITFMQAKLDLANGPETNKVKKMVLSSWMVRLYLSLMKNLSSSTIGSGNKEKDELLTKKKCSKLRQNLFSFLKANAKILDRKTIYQMMENLGFTEELLEFASMLQDIEIIIQFHLERESWADALKVLMRAHTIRSESLEHLIYKTSTILLINSPEATIECWLKFPEIDYEKLLPAILAYKRFDVAGLAGGFATLKFFLVLIFEKNFKSKALCECYLSLMIMNSYNEDLSTSLNNIIKTLDHLKRCANDEDPKTLYYDPNFLLRTCLRFKRIEPAIFILVNDLCLHKQALSTALSHNLIMQAEMILRNYEDTIYEPRRLEVMRNFSVTIDKETAVDPSRSKLEDSQNSVRLHLWVSYAKHIIEEVCRNRNFDLSSTSNFNPAIDATDTDDLKNMLKFFNSSANDISENSKGTKLEDSSLSFRLSEAVRYLLRLSFSAKDNASVLTIKDLLPLLPKSIMISNFKAEIVSSLSAFNDKINQLGLEMQNSSITAKKLRIQLNESKSLKTKGHIYTIIEPGESCNLCRKLLMLKKHILFPNCHHGFHKDCMIRYLLQLKGDYTFKKSFRNFKQFSSIADKSELDDILLKECLLCNESNLNTIDDSLIDEEHNSAQEWLM